MRTFTGLLFCLLISISGNQKANAQTIEILAGNTLNGTVNGTLLGGATMALTGNSNFDALRVGVGAGTLYGIGVGVYDVTNAQGQQLIVSGLFNDGNNTSIIVLLDTFYGAAAGAIIASSIMLIAEEPIVDGLRYGSATGAWLGFGVGLVDAFILAERVTPGSASIHQPSNIADGLVGVQFNKKNSVGLFEPSFISTFEVNASDAYQKFTPTVNLVNYTLNF